MDAQRRRILVWSAWGVGVGALVAGVAYLWVTRSSEFLEEWRRLASYGGWNGAKVSAVIALLLVALALPLAIAQGVSNARFARTERRLRAERPEDQVTPYDGPEGDGVRFEGPSGVLLLLRPVGGLGAPRLVDATPPAPDAADAPEAATVEAEA